MPLPEPPVPEPAPVLPPAAPGVPEVLPLPLVLPVVPLVLGLADVPRVPDSVVVPGPDVVPVPDAPMLLAPELLDPMLLPLPVVLDPMLLAPEPLVPVLDVELRVGDWQPAARTAASARLSSAAGRMLDVLVMEFLVKQNANCAWLSWQSAYPVAHA